MQEMYKIKVNIFVVFAFYFLIISPITPIKVLHETRNIKVCGNSEYHFERSKSTFAQLLIRVNVDQEHIYRQGNLRQSLVWHQGQFSFSCDLC